MECTWSRCCFGTSELSCFPKYMSEEMAFVSPNFIWASPVSTTGTGFLLAEGLQAKELTMIMIKQRIELFLFCFFKFPHSSLSHVIFFWHVKTQTHSLNLFPFLYLVKYFYFYGCNKSYFSSTDVIVEVRKKSGSGFLLSFIQPFSSPSSSHRERNLLGGLSGREKLMKE